MRLGAARRIRNARSHYELGNGGFRDDLGHYVRSNWEANFARIMKIQGKEYEYEPKSFVLSNGRTYTPDFLIEGVFYEIKGRWTEQAKQKFEIFEKEYPEVKVQIIDCQKYKELRQQFQKLILWEGK